MPGGHSECWKKKKKEARLWTITPTNPKHSEVNLLPNFPSGENSSSLKQLRQKIVEVKKTEKSLALINKMMQTTFALRQQTTVKTCSPVKGLLDYCFSCCLFDDMVIYTLGIGYF